MGVIAERVHVLGSPLPAYLDLCLWSKPTCIVYVVYRFRYPQNNSTFDEKSEQLEKQRVWMLVAHVMF